MGRIEKGIVAADVCVIKNGLKVEMSRCYIDYISICSLFYRDKRIYEVIEWGIQNIKI